MADLENNSTLALHNHTTICRPRLLGYYKNFGGRYKHSLKTQLPKKVSKKTRNGTKTYLPIHQ